MSHIHRPRAQLRPAGCRGVVGLMLGVVLLTASACSSGATADPAGAVEDGAVVVALGDAAASGLSEADRAVPDEETLASARDRAADFFASLESSAAEAGPVPLEFSAARSAVVSCLQGFGFEVAPPSSTPGSSGILVRGIWSDRRSAELTAALEACQGAAVAAGVALDWSDPRAWDQRYEALVKVHACLVANGFESPSPPERSAFSVAHPWDPYAALLGGATTFVVSLDGSMSGEMLEKLTAAVSVCPRP